MSINISAVLGAVEDHAKKLGRFDRVLSHEPKNTAAYEPQNLPGYGLSCAIWPEEIIPYPRASGLDVTSVRLTLKVRVYRARTADPLDVIDREMIDVVNDLWVAYHGDFTLGGLVMNVDILGMSGQPMRARAGYLEEDEQVFRIYDIDLPLVLADVFQQTA